MNSSDGNLDPKPEKGIFTIEYLKKQGKRMHQKLQNIEWKNFKQLPLKERAKLFNLDGVPFHLIFAQQCTREYIEILYMVATKLRRMHNKTEASSKMLSQIAPNLQANIYFGQPSTRTRMSFEAACSNLGMHSHLVHDATTSSQSKGESELDTIQTLVSYGNFLIMRHGEERLAEKAAHHLSRTNRPIPLINGGSGSDQHPTQALLDMYTLLYTFEEKGGLEGKKIALVGDLKNGRTIKSLAYLLSLYKGVEIIFCAPDRYQISSDEQILRDLEEADIKYRYSDDFESILKSSNAVYMTRIQDEYDKSGKTEKNFSEEYCLLVEKFDLVGDETFILHPLPRRNEIHYSFDNDNRNRALYWRQVRNGMWMRTAILAHLMGQEEKILSYSLPL
jgi:aspartate carbamoyltransferase catalytic subunit